MALLSALVFQEKSDVAPELPPALAAAVEQLSAIAWQAGAVQAEAGLPLLPDEFQRQVLKFGLTEVRTWHLAREMLAPEHRGTATPTVCFVTACSGVHVSGGPSAHCSPARCGHKQSSTASRCGAKPAV